MFTDLYLQTTNPELSFYELLKPSILTNILLSTFFHTFAYTIFLNLVSYIFLGKRLTNTINYRIMFSLFVIMFFGFFARFLHVKEVYKAYNEDLQKTRSHLDKLYIGWIFIS